MAKQNSKELFKSEQFEDVLLDVREGTTLLNINIWENLKDFVLVALENGQKFLMLPTLR